MAPGGTAKPQSNAATAFRRGARYERMDAGMNQVLQTIFERYSARAFQEKQVAQADLELILQAGIAAPTAMNSQKWLLTAIQNPALLEQMGRAVRQAKQREEAYCFYYRAPAAVVVTFPADYGYARDDGSAAIQNMLLAARALGIDSCWVSQLKETQDDPGVRAFLSECGIPADHRVVGVVSLGYAVQRGAPKTRDRSAYRMIT